MIDYRILQHKTEVTDGKKIWYIAELLGILMELDISTHELKCLWRIPAYYKPVFYRGVFYYEKKLYIIPYCGEWMYVYDIVNGKSESISLVDDLELMACIKVGGFLYFYGFRPIVIKYNPILRSVKRIEFDHEMLGFHQSPKGWFWTEAFNQEGSLYLPVQNKNILVKLNWDDSVQSVILGNHMEDWLLRSIDVYDGGFYALHSNNEVKNLQVKSAKYGKNGSLEWEKKEIFGDDYAIYPYVHAICALGKWLILPYGMKDVYLLGLNDGHLRRIYRFDATFSKEINQIKNGFFNCSTLLDGNVLYGINQISGEFVKIDLTTENVEVCSINWNRDASEKVMKDSIEDGCFVYEMDGLIGLEDFLDMIGERKGEKVAKIPWTGGRYEYSRWL